MQKTHMFLRENGEQKKFPFRAVAACTAFAMFALAFVTDSPVSGAVHAQAAAYYTEETLLDARIQAEEIFDEVKKNFDPTKTTQMKAQEEIERQERIKKNELIAARTMALKDAMLQEQEAAEYEAKAQKIYEEQMELIEKEREKAEAMAAGRVWLEKDEIRLLERLVQAEAGGESYEGKMLVANVVLNRVESSKFPNTVTKVIYQKSQFTPASTGKINRVKVSKETKAAVAEVLNGKDNSGGALYFVAKRYCNASWFDRALTWLFKVGNHDFYK
ncbi:cell wall hydrolase [Anaerolentibacter hominis]|uniref:cell wall hydrolase n=1 Tax=Anaerolentibacter hominis TaxID=3079009 RepID=UPI0031B7F611